MNGEEPSQCGAADCVAAKNEVRDPVADDWNPPCLLSRYYYRPRRG